jgi:hypothetical protein
MIDRILARTEGNCPMDTLVRTVRPAGDPLGYEGDVVARVRAMAEDALAGVNEHLVEEEAAILRARLGLRSNRNAGNAADPRR